MDFQFHILLHEVGIDTLQIEISSNLMNDFAYKLLTKDEKLSYKKISENTIEFKSDFISPSFIYQLGKVRIVQDRVGGHAERPESFKVMRYPIAFRNIAFNDIA